MENGFWAFNGIRALPLMTFNDSAVCDCLMTTLWGCHFLSFVAIQRPSGAIAIRCHLMP